MLDGVTLCTSINYDVGFVSIERREVNFFMFLLLSCGVFMDRIALLCLHVCALIALCVIYSTCNCYSYLWGHTYARYRGIEQCFMFLLLSCDVFKASVSMCSNCIVCVMCISMNNYYSYL